MKRTAQGLGADEIRKLGELHDRCAPSYAHQEIPGGLPVPLLIQDDGFADFRMRASSRIKETLQGNAKVFHGLGKVKPFPDPGSHLSEAVNILRRGTSEGTKSSA